MAVAVEPAATASTSTSARTVALPRPCVPAPTRAAAAASPSASPAAAPAANGAHGVSATTACSHDGGAVSSQGGGHGHPASPDGPPVSSAAVNGAAAEVGQDVLHLHGDAPVAGAPAVGVDIDAAVAKGGGVAQGADAQGDVFVGYGGGAVDAGGVGVVAPATPLTLSHQLLAQVRKKTNAVLYVPAVHER